MSGRGKTSDAPVDVSGWSVHTLRTDLLIRVDVFETRGEALEAVGLSEQDAPAAPLSVRDTARAMSQENRGIAT